MSQAGSIIAAADDGFAAEEGLGKADFRILIVDDDTAILDMLSRYLQVEEFTCRTAGHADEALAALEVSEFHLVITDIRMPGLSGVELAEKISGRYPSTLLIFMTGYAEYQSLAGAIKLRPFGFLEKPFAPAQLVELVQRALALTIYRSRQQARATSLETQIVDKSRDLEFQQERLLAEKELLHGIISHANFGLIAADTQQQVHLINDYAASLLRLTDAAIAEVPGALLSDMLSEELLPVFDSLCRESLGSTASPRRETSITFNDSRLNVLAYPVIHRDHVTAVVFVIHDVTETETLQRQLLQSAKLASIGELAAGVAHEINNPLGFATSNCSTLNGYIVNLLEYTSVLEASVSEQAGSDEAAERLRAMRKERDIDYIRTDAPPLIKETLDGLARVSKIVKDLKTFARSDSDTPQSCQIHALIEDALNLVRNEIKYKLEIVRDFGTLPEVICYPNQLVQVFTNMFVNAAQAVQERGILTITTGVGRHSVRVAVKDTGVGITEKNLARVFDPFYTTKPPGKGTGMGLSISYGIVEKHGGTISVTSQLGKGTEFVIQLPLCGTDHSVKGDTRP